jgi:hypothetical protein
MSNLKPDAIRMNFIAKRVYNDNATFEEIGIELSITKTRVSQIYSKFARIARSNRHYLEEYGHPYIHKGGVDVDIIKVDFISISKELALYNLERKEKSKVWTTTDTSGYSKLHKVFMIRTNTHPDGTEYWECNKYFFEMSVKYPTWQNTKNGIFTQIE